MARTKLSASLRPIVWLSALGATSGCYAEAHTEPAYVTATYVPAHMRARSFY